MGDTVNKNLNHGEELDKVPPMSRRTEDIPYSFSMKSRKNTNKTEELKNVMSGVAGQNTNNNMKNSKVCSSASA